MGVGFRFCTKINLSFYCISHKLFEVPSYDDKTYMMFFVSLLPGIEMMVMAVIFGEGDTDNGGGGDYDDEGDGQEGKKEKKVLFVIEIKAKWGLKASLLSGNGISSLSSDALPCLFILLPNIA